VLADSQVERTASMELNADSGTLINASDNVLAKELQKVVSAEPSKNKPGRLQNLFSPQGRFIVSTLRDIQEEQQRLSNTITSLRVSAFSTFYFVSACCLYACLCCCF